MKSVILARVSSREQESGFSPEAQVVRLKDYAASRDLEVIKVYNFVESATIDNRKNFDSILSFISTQPGTIAILVETIDRILRDFKDAVTLDELRKQGKIELHFYRENLVVHLVVHKESNSADILRWDMGIMFAKSYVLQLSDNVKRSNELMVRRGEWPGKAPIGYLNVVLDNDKKWIDPDPERSGVVARLYDLYSQGKYSMAMLRNIAKEEGLANKRGVPLSTSQIDWMLRNPFYYGVMAFKGKLYPHAYTPIITKEVFDRVQQVKANWNKKPFQYAAKPYVFRDLLTCAECGCTVTFERAKGKYVYGHCTNYRKVHDKITYVKEEFLVDQIKQLLKDMTIPDKVLPWLTESLQKSHADKKHFHEKMMTNLRKEYDRIESFTEMMYEDKLIGRITPEMYDRRLKEYKEKQADLLLQMEQHSKADESYYIQGSKVLELANRAYKLFESSEVPQKRELLQFLLQNSKLNGKKIDVVLQKPFDLILSQAKSNNWLRWLVSNLMAVPSLRPCR